MMIQLVVPGVGAASGVGVAAGVGEAAGKEVTDGVKLGVEGGIVAEGCGLGLGVARAGWMRMRSPGWRMASMARLLSSSRAFSSIP